MIASFHIIWSIYATPKWAKRRFVFDNSRTISVVYAMGAPSFFLLLLGTVTGTMGNTFTQEGYQTKDWVAPALGLGVGLTVTFVFVVCSGSILCKAVRPWKIADEKLNKKKTLWHKLGRTMSTFFRYDPGELSSDSSDDDEERVNRIKDDPDGDMEICDVDQHGFGPLMMTLVSQKLCAAGFTLELLLRVNNEVLLNQLLQGAGVDKAGERLRVILFVRDMAPPTTKIKPRESVGCSEKKRSCTDGRGREDSDSQEPVQCPVG